uniref:Saposin B-type domain-containing protein n=1 Tax=Panagrolaimus davidi TaxID=227884 RepID=A0A914Q0P1_9BILA
MMWFYTFLLFAILVNSLDGAVERCNYKDKDQQVECINKRLQSEIDNPKEFPGLCSLCIVFVDYFTNFLHNNERTIEEKVACNYACD